MTLKMWCLQKTGQVNDMINDREYISAVNLPSGSKKYIKDEEVREVVQGIDSTANNYIEMKSGQHEYLSTTVPTGNIPTGSVGMGWADGTWTYKSGSNVSEGVPTANLTDIRNFVNSATDTRDYFQARLFSGQVISNQKIDSTGRKNLSIVLPAGEHALRLRHSGSNTDINIMTYSVVLTKETAFNCSFDVIGYNPSTVGGLVLDNIMLNEGSATLPYEPYGAKKFPFYANGQNLTDYTIYGNDGGVGEKTANLFDKNATIDTTTLSWAVIYTVSGLDTSKSYTLSTNYVRPSNVQAASLYLATSTSVSSSADGVWSGLSKTKQPDEDGTLLVIIRMDQGTTDAQPIYDDVLNGTVLVMLNEGSTALPYEPYGYKIPVGCGGQTTNIYIDSPLDGGDSIDYTTSQTAIPTVDGANSLICDTTVQPSKVSLTYTGWHSDLDNTTARLEALENAPAPSGMTYDTLYEGTTASSYPYPLAHEITNYKFIIIAVGYSNVYTTAVVPVAVWNTITGGGNNYVITVDTAHLSVNADNITPTNSNNRIVYGVYGIK